MWIKYVCNCGEQNFVWTKFFWVGENWGLVDIPYYAVPSSFTPLHHILSCQNVVCPCQTIPHAFIVYWISLNLKWILYLMTSHKPTSVSHKELIKLWTHQVCATSTFSFTATAVVRGTAAIFYYVSSNWTLLLRVGEPVWKRILRSFTSFRWMLDTALNFLDHIVFNHCSKHTQWRVISVVWNRVNTATTVTATVDVVMYLWSFNSANSADKQVENHGASMKINTISIILYK